MDDGCCHLSMNAVAIYLPTPPHTHPQREGGHSINWLNCLKCDDSIPGLEILIQVKSSVLNARTYNSIHCGHLSTISRALSKPKAVLNLITVRSI